MVQLPMMAFLATSNSSTGARCCPRHYVFLAAWPDVILRFIRAKVISVVIDDFYYDLPTARKLSDE
eukprot:scaffold344364_cov21-Prasinocladus_malaysianus.AAC.1